MIIHERLREIATELGSDLFGMIGTKFFLTEAPQSSTPYTLPYVVYRMQQMPLMTQNGPRCRMRPWELTLYIFGKNALEAQIVGAQVEKTFCEYKKTTAGAADTDIQAITIEDGLVDLDPFTRAPASKIYPAALVLKVYEQIGA